MKAPLFDYYAPRSLEETLGLLASLGESARILAGGQTLMPMLNFRIVAPDAIVDINNVAGLDYCRWSDSGLEIGAMTRQSKLEDDRRLAERYPVIAAALPHIAHRAIRNRGTIGGSLSHADPSAEWGGLVCALDAKLVLGRAGKPARTVPAADFFTGLMSTSIEPGEILLAVQLPLWPKNAGWSFMEISRRRGDFAVAGVIAIVETDETGVCSAARVALFGVEDVPTRLDDCEVAIVGDKFTDVSIARAAIVAAECVRPMSSLHASSEYRRHLTGVLVRRSLQEAADRARRRAAAG